ncbi:MAG: iron-containing redox enzyme family protein, partial [Chloroflexota bacterium]
ALWLRFCQALGLDPAQVTTGTPAPATERLIDTYRTLCASGIPAQGLAALLAYEAQVPAVAVQKVAGLMKFYAISDPKALSFFSAHLEVDGRHATVERSLVFAGARTAAEQASALAAVDRALDAFWGFLDGAYACAPASA